MIIRPTFPVLGGAAIGLIAGAAVYGTVSTASAAESTSVKPPKTVAAAPALAARCAEGQKLEDGVCIVHVVKTVVVPAPSAAGSASGGLSANAGSDGRTGPAESSHEATEGPEGTEDAMEESEDALDDSESEPGEDDAAEAPSSDDSSDAPRS